MKTLARLAIIAVVITMALAIGVLAADSHWLIAVLCTPATAVCIVFAGEAASDIEWSIRVAWIVARVRFNRWRRRLRELAGGSTPAPHPYRGTPMVILPRLRDFDGIDTAVARLRLNARAFGAR